MNQITGLIISFLLFILFLAGSFIFHKFRNLGNEVSVSVEFNPPQAVRGRDVNFAVICTSRNTRKIDTLEGSLICKRFSGYNGDWRDWTDFPLLSRGEIEERFIFSFGKDLILAAGNANKYEGYIPIPAESFPTDTGNLMQVHWRFLVKITSKGYAPAVFERELVVLTQDHPDSLSLQNEETQEMPELTGKRKGSLRQNVQLVFSDSAGQTEKQVKNNKQSSFGYLEFEDDKNQ
ncbi:MAG: hypothetical protein LWY06_05475 [Firmicutes bacterium]|nr:hypothetical protein [Bacillota bacterium]